MHAQPNKCVYGLNFVFHNIISQCVISDETSTIYGKSYNCSPPPGCFQTLVQSFSIDSYS